MSFLDKIQAKLNKVEEWIDKDEDFVANVAAIGVSGIVVSGAVAIFTEASKPVIIGAGLGAIAVGTGSYLIQRAIEF